MKPLLQDLPDCGWLSDLQCALRGLAAGVHLAAFGEIARSYINHECGAWPTSPTVAASGTCDLRPVTAALTLWIVFRLIPTIWQRPYCTSQSAWPRRSLSAELC